MMSNLVDQHLLKSLKESVQDEVKNIAMLKSRLCYIQSMAEDIGMIRKGHLCSITKVAEFKDVCVSHLQDILDSCEASNTLISLSKPKNIPYPSDIDVLRTKQTNQAHKNTYTLLSDSCIREEFQGGTESDSDWVPGN